MPREGRPALYLDGRKLANAVRHKLEETADVREPAALPGDLSALGAERRTVRIDNATAADALARIVTEAGGRQLLHRTVKAGETVGLTGKLPLSVVVGRAAGVQVQVHGKPFDLAPITRCEEALRPHTVTHVLGNEVLFDCDLSAQRRPVGVAKKSI